VLGAWISRFASSVSPIIFKLLAAFPSLYFFLPLALLSYPDLGRTAELLGVIVTNTTKDLSLSRIGTCDVFEEKQIGGDRYNVITGCSKAKTATILLRGEVVEKELSGLLRVSSLTLRGRSS
jgi:hypothetical protein